MVRVTKLLKTPREKLLTDDENNSVALKLALTGFGAICERHFLKCCASMCIHPRHTAVADV